MDVKKYLEEVKAETAKVNWPSRKKMLRDSSLVIGASLATALFLGAADLVFSQAITRFILK